MKDYPAFFSVAPVLMTGGHEHHCASHAVLTSFQPLMSAVDLPRQSFAGRYFHVYPEFFHVQ